MFNILSEVTLILPFDPRSILMYEDPALHTVPKHDALQLNPTSARNSLTESAVFYLTAMIPTPDNCSSSWENDWGFSLRLTACKATLIPKITCHYPCSKSNNQVPSLFTRLLNVAGQATVESDTVRAGVRDRPTPHGDLQPGANPKLRGGAIRNLKRI